MMAAASQPKVKVAILISGRGSNMTSLIKAANHKHYPARICLVISNKAGVDGIFRAQDMGIETLVVPHKDFTNRESFEAKLHQTLTEKNIEFICCAGFMRVLTGTFVRKWAGRIINIHPSLLPKYKGLKTHSRAIESGDKYHGCTVHYVTEDLDSGDILLQEKLAVYDSDTPESLAARILELEHHMYPKALAHALELL